ncbi:cell division protein FtsW (lipid II flippase) [Clostridium beijerinckii]|nr:cell division protein FtsW (lipid II flippase) [Clostridium beijerinckii]
MKVIGSKRKSKMGEIDYGIFYTVALLLTIGVVMVYSASSYYAMFMYKDSMFFLKKELMAGVVGVIAMAVAMSVDYHKIKKYTAIIMIATIPILLAVFLFPGTNGAQRWINLGPLSFQPSELAKYVVVLFLARSLEVKGEGVKDFKTGIVPYLATSGFYAAIVLAEKI